MKLIRQIGFLCLLSAVPALLSAGFHPHRAEWSLAGLAQLTVPMLAVLGLVDQNMVETGPAGDEVAPFLPVSGRVIALADCGHFVHVERPDVVAAEVLRFLGGCQR